MSIYIITSVLHLCTYVCCHMYGCKYCSTVFAFLHFCVCLLNRSNAMILLDVTWWERLLCCSVSKRKQRLALCVNKELLYRTRAQSTSKVWQPMSLSHSHTHKIMKIIMKNSLYWAQGERLSVSQNFQLTNYRGHLIKWLNEWVQCW